MRINLKEIKRNTNIWSVLSFIIVALVLLPNLSIFMNLFSSPNENWAHIKEYLLNEYIFNSIILIVFTVFFTIIIGTILSWIITLYDFPLKKFFKWAIILPMAIPTNIAAYTYSGMLSYTGVVQTTLRNNGITVNQKWFNIMSIEGAIFIFTFFLFPYVYITTKSFLEKQSSSLIENARVLGKNSFQIFLQVILPISKGAIIAGASLVMLEVINDYGVVSYFGINTFATAIFTTWFGMYDLSSAIRLAALLMTTIIILLFIEKLLRGRKRYSFTTSKITPLRPKKLEGITKYLAVGFCSIIFMISFLIPFIQLINWGINNYKNVIGPEFFRIIYNTILVSTVATLLIVILAIIVANFCRINDTKLSKLFSKLVLLGYSIPAPVIAIGILTFFISIDKLIGGEDSSLLLSSSLLMLIFAYTIRYLGIGYNTIESGFEKVGTKYLEASRMLGVGITKSFFKVDLKLINSSVLVGFMLVLMEVLKELPLTLILRPFNFHTLATKTYQYASDELIQYASIPALIIIFISIIAIVSLNKIGDKAGK